MRIRRYQSGSPMQARHAAPGTYPGHRCAGAEGRCGFPSGWFPAPEPCALAGGREERCRSARSESGRRTRRCSSAPTSASCQCLAEEQQRHERDHDPGWQRPSPLGQRRGRGQEQASDFSGGPGLTVIGGAARVPGRTCSLGSRHPRQSPGSSGKRRNHARQRYARTGTACPAADRLAMVSS